MHNNTWNISIPEGYNWETQKGQSISKFKIPSSVLLLVTV